MSGRDGGRDGSLVPTGDSSISPPLPPLPLPFQRMLLQNVLSTDALLILARGLGLLTLISHLLYTYDNPEIPSTGDTDKVYKNFVITIGAEAREETLIGQNIAELVTTYGGTGAGLQVVNTDKVGVDQRHSPQIVSSFQDETIYFRRDI